MKHFAVIVLMLMAQLPGTAGPLPTPGSTRSLFAQSTAGTLARSFPDHDISFLLLDAGTGDIVAVRWTDSNLPIPLGSLVKPFAALAYGERHGYVFPEHTCLGTKTGCWRPQGHGKVGLTAAIAYSCNSYFRALTADLRACDVSSTSIRFALDPPERHASGPALAGLGSQWKISPVRMAQAYLELVREVRNGAAKEILDGMAESGNRGTGAAVDRALHLSRALVKTGTAECTHSPHAPGDGFTVALVPADEPKVLLMVRVHGVPGSKAAEVAGAMLRRIED